MQQALTDTFQPSRDRHPLRQFVRPVAEILSPFYTENVRAVY